MTTGRGDSEGLLVMHKDEEPTSRPGKLLRVTRTETWRRGVPALRVRVVGQPRGALLRGTGVHPCPPSRAEGVLSSLIHYFSTLLLLFTLLLVQPRMHHLVPMLQ